MTPAEELRLAAAEIQRRGWTQDDWAWYEKGDDDATCKVCALGAINVVHFGRAYPGGAVGDFAILHSPAANALGDFLFEDAYSDKTVENQIPAWNDAPERTADEVVVAMLAAADRWESEHSDEIPPSKGDGPFLTPLGAI